MRLELGTFRVREVAFGRRTRWADGRLEIDRAEVLEAVRVDLRIASASLELARPGESVRIWPVRDVIEPRIKVEGPGTVYPGICGRPVTTVGEGRTHRLAGVGVTEVSSVNWHEAGGDYVDVFLDLSGPWAELIPLSRLQHVCLVVEPDPALESVARNEAVHHAALVVADRLALAARSLDPPEREVFELRPVDPALPGVVYIQCLHSPQAMSHSDQTFCTATYGLTRLTPPWLMHPNEILDGAVTGPYRTAFATSWTVANNPVLLDLYRRHGVDLRFLGVIVLRTEWTTQHEKELLALQAAKTARMLGARGALVTWDAGGNEFVEVIHTVRACERLGIQTVFLTSEDTPAGGAPTMLEPLPEADAIVSTGFFNASLLELGDLPPVERVIGLPTRIVGETREQAVPVAGPLASPWRHDDHYGFGHLSAFAY
jgi:glycine reductase